MLSLQKDINNIIEQHIPTADKIVQLQDFFAKKNIRYFTDFDDTISSKHSLTSFKLKVLSFLQRKHPTRNYARLAKNIAYKPSFVEIIKQHNITQCIILSRNNQQLLEYVIHQETKQFQSHGLTILGVVGSNKKFHMTTKRKLRMMPENTCIISDIFEYQALKKHNKLICVDRFSRGQYIIRTGKKIWSLGIFTLTAIGLFISGKLHTKK